MNQLHEQYAQTANIFNYFDDAPTIMQGINLTIAFEEAHSFLICRLVDWNGISDIFISDSMNALIDDPDRTLVENILKTLNTSNAKIIAQTKQTRFDTCAYHCSCALDELMKLLLEHQQVPRILRYTKEHLTAKMKLFNKNAEQSSSYKAQEGTLDKHVRFLPGFCSFCTFDISSRKNPYIARRAHERFWHCSTIDRNGEKRPMRPFTTIQLYN